MDTNSMKLSMKLLPFATFSSRLICVLTAFVLAGCAAGFHHRDGMNALARQDFATAVKELELATKLKPNDIEYRRDWLKVRESATNKLLMTGGTALALGQIKEAVQAYQAILQYDPENARALAGKEDVLRFSNAKEETLAARDALQRGEVAIAQEWISRALRNAPEMPAARVLKRELDTLQAKEVISTPSLGANYKKPINLEFRDNSIKMIFDALSRTTGINFIFDRDVRNDQRTSVFLKGTSLDDAIDVILSTNQLDKKVLNATSVLIYPNTSQKQKEYQDLIVKAFYMANVEAKNAANMLKTVLKVKDIFVDDKYNMLILRENSETIALAEKLLNLHDLEEPEVMLDVEVLEINRSSLFNLGLQVNSQLTVAPLNDLIINSNGNGGVGNGTGTGTQTLRLNDMKRLNSDLLGITLPSATLNLKKTDGDANLLANPSIRVRDREKAKIMIGDKVPVVTTTSTGNFVSENINYLDVGLKLEVEPDIHLRDEIGLKISMEVSSLVSSVKTNNGSQAYQIGTRNFSSALRLRDGETQILAGLISDEDRSSANRIPLLGDLPILGRLFSNQSDNRQKTEIVLSITPRLIRNIQRASPSAESFWSGTETTLRNKPLTLKQIESSDVANKASGTKSGTTNNPAITTSVAGPNSPKINWQGPSKAKKDDVQTIDLEIESGQILRAASMQLAFNAADIEIIAVKDGDYFSKNGKGNFGHAVDVPSGRISIGLGNSEGIQVKEKTKLLSVTYKVLRNAGETEISVLGMTPIGVNQAVDRPALPNIHKIQIEP
ncbi:general secretion pathway protein GspD [Undibacterium amnicola]|uniref:General secretion pathway protein GspD n=2 Tax=Undibacterium amnicola TaxID=1834038 RepID=A0ABR6XTU7_9BURK|nr:general secretion pathway protein GspD [Undibacterium amnicola]